jgi:hypothetical protein
MIKNLHIFIVFFLLQLTGYGAVLVVSNQPGVERDYSSIQSAIEQAAPYDTIFVKGSPTNYGNVLLEKPLVLIGEGFSGEVHSGHTAKITRILFTSNPYRRTISSGSTIIGFEFPYFPGQRPNLITVATDRVSIENVTIERNWMWFVEIVGNAGNWVFRNNIILGWVNGGGKNNPEIGANGFIFYNNILNSLFEFKRGNLVLENNIILGRLKDVSGARVVNNIFSREDIILENVFGCRFQNNLAATQKIGSEELYEVTTKFESKILLAGEANTGSGNRVGVDPGFVYWPTNDIMGGTVFMLSDSSPAKRGGLGGREIGIFGGRHPFPSHSFLNPEIDDPFPTFVTSIY